MHAADLRELGVSLQADGAPAAARAPRGDTNAVALLVDRLPHAIDPPDAECVVAGLGPGHAGVGAAVVADADEELGHSIVVLLEPLPEVGRRTEEGGFHAWKIRYYRMNDIARRRLANQHLTAATLTTPADVVRLLGAVQAQDYAGAKWAVAL